MRTSLQLLAVSFRCVIALGMVGPQQAHAARPMITTTPACNFTGNLELTFGGARTHDSDRTYASDIQGQGKLLVRPLETSGVGIAVVAGTVRHTQLDARDWFISVPISVSLLDAAS